MEQKSGSSTSKIMPSSHSVTICDDFDSCCCCWCCCIATVVVVSACNCCCCPLNWLLLLMLTLLLLLLLPNELLLLLVAVRCFICGRERGGRVAIREKGMKKVSVRDAMQIPNNTRGWDSDNKDVKLLTAHFKCEWVSVSVCLPACRDVGKGSAAGGVA